MTSRFKRACLAEWRPVSPESPILDDRLGHGETSDRGTKEDHEKAKKICACSRRSGVAGRLTARMGPE